MMPAIAIAIDRPAVDTPHPPTPAVALAVHTDQHQKGSPSGAEIASAGPQRETSAARLKRWGFKWAHPAVEPYEVHPNDAQVTWARHQLAAAVATGCTLSARAYALAAQVGVVLPGAAPVEGSASAGPLARGRLTPTLVAARLRPALRLARAALRGRTAVAVARASLAEALRQAAALPRGMGPKYAALALDSRHALTSLDARLACVDHSAADAGAEGAP